MNYEFSINIMLFWALYDVQNNKSRYRLANACKAAGLFRVQKSVFLGPLSKKNRKELLDFSRTILNPSHDKFYLSPVPPQAIKRMICVGRQFSKSRVLGTKKVYFF